ncbi:MAG: hypothetical protein HQK65_08850 [Desulfamplus sp.]|nr:hypothetical protein [Desulfamplus sp.]
MIKNKIIKKIVSVNFSSILIFSCLMSLLSADVYGSDTETQDSTKSTFTFENAIKNVPESLSEQIALYWEYKGTRQFDAAYLIEAPHTKYQIPLETYRIYHSKARKLKGCRISNIENSTGLAVVTIGLIFDIGEKGVKSSSKTQTINDHWIELNGKWYHVYLNPFANIR